MLDLTDALFIGTLFSVFMLSVAGGDELAIGGGIRIKDSNIKKRTLVTASPKPACRNIQPCTFICDGGGS